MNTSDPTPPTLDHAASTLDDAEATARRVQRNATLVLVLLAIVLGAWTRSFWQLTALLVSGALMLLNFRGLMAVTDRITSGSGRPPTFMQGLFLLGRYVLLGIVLCAIVLMPGVGPIPVALGLSILVIAILLEAILQVFNGATRRS